MITPDPTTGAFAPEHNDDSAPLDHQHAAPLPTPLRAPIRPPQIVTQQQPQAAPLPMNNYNPESVEFLREEGFGDEAIAAALANNRTKRSSHGTKHGVVTPELIVAHAATIIEMAEGKRLLSAKSVGWGLIRLGAIARPRGFNAIGDKLHGHGLMLPRVRINGVMSYDLGCIGWTAQEREARTARLMALEPAALLTVAGEIKEEAVAADPTQEVASGESEPQDVNDGHEEEAENNTIGGSPDDAEYTEGEPVGGSPDDAEYTEGESVGDYHEDVEG
jgi:hypothetical protein